MGNPSVANTGVVPIIDVNAAIGRLKRLLSPDLTCHISAADDLGRPVIPGGSVANGTGHVKVHFTISVGNTGKSSAVDFPVAIAVTSSNGAHDYYTDKRTMSLSPGQSSNVDFSVEFTYGGSHGEPVEAAVLVDPDDVISELDEANNSCVLPFTVNFVT